MLGRWSTTGGIIANGKPALCAVFTLATMTACGNAATEDSGDYTVSSAADFATDIECGAISDAPVYIEGGTFTMGQDDIYTEEGPRRETRVDGYWIDPHEVTNRQFAAFVGATGYVTVAERPVDPALFGVPEEQIPPDLLVPGSAVFTPPDRPSNRYTDWWSYVPGAYWEKPYGPAGPEAQANQPVVHLAWDDMVAYANWAGGRIPTEAEWEYAASAGADPYSEQPDGQSANSWQGLFPLVNEETDGFKGIAPVGCFHPNANGLYDMVGNVWEVTQDYYRPGHDPADTDNPRGPSENAAYDPYNPGLASRVMKGGFVSVRAQLLPALPPRRPPGSRSRPWHQQRRIPPGLRSITAILEQSKIATSESVSAPSMPRHPKLQFDLGRRCDHGSD